MTLHWTAALLPCLMLPRCGLLLLALLLLLAGCGQSSELPGQGMPEIPDESPGGNQPGDPAEPPGDPDWPATDRVDAGRFLLAGESLIISPPGAEEGYSWSLAYAPPGHETSLKSVDEGAAEFSTEQPGRYFLRATPASGEPELIAVTAVEEPLAQGLSVNITGLPEAAGANVAVNNGSSLSRWIASSTSFTGIPQGEYEIVAGSVAAGDVVYVAHEPVQRIRLGAGQSGEVSISYSRVQEGLFASDPDLDRCEPGSLSETGKARALGRLNFIRALAHAPAVAYNGDWDERVQEAALIYVQNRTPTPHDPPADAVCYSPAGAVGAANSNLAVRYGTSPGLVQSSPEAQIDTWFRDSGVPTLGHRRWNLDPRTTRVAFGMTYGRLQRSGRYEQPLPYGLGAALHIVDDQRRNLSEIGAPFIALPMGDMPASIIDPAYPYPSISFVATGSVGIQDATVTVTTAAGERVEVTEVAFSYAASGLSNMLRWRQDRLTPGETYLVVISNVLVAGEAREYAYTFTLR